jgi:hypothetical protein
MPTRTLLISILFSTLVSILFAILATACSSGPHHPVAAAPPPRVVPRDVHAVAVDDLVGVWRGTALGTPFGDFPFAITFDREPTGDVHGRLAGRPGMYLDFRFHRDRSRWVLIEEGAIPELGKQSGTLAPVPGATAPARWTDGDPAHLAVALAVTADALEWTTTIDGKPHAVFKMARARGEAAEQIRQAIARLNSVQ